MICNFKPLSDDICYFLPNYFVNFSKNVKHITADIYHNNYDKFKCVKMAK